MKTFFFLVAGAGLVFYYLESKKGQPLANLPISIANNSALLDQTLLPQIQSGRLVNPDGTVVQPAQSSQIQFDPMIPGGMLVSVQ